MKICRNEHVTAPLVINKCKFFIIFCDVKSDCIITYVTGMSLHRTTIFKQLLGAYYLKCCTILQLFLSV